MQHPWKKTYRHKSLHFTSSQLCVTGRGFNNLSQVRMGRHIATGQLVAIKQTNLDECTEEELLQLLVGCWICRMSHSFWIVAVSQVPHLFCVSKPRTKFSSPDCSATRTCWLLAWFSAPAASSGSSPHLWPMVSHFYTSMYLLELISSFPLLLFLTGSADSLLRTYFPDGMSESLVAYLLYGVLKALEYLHRMGYVHRSVRKTKDTNLVICSGDIRNICLPVPHWLQRGEGQPHSAVRRGPRLPLGAPQCLQYDAWGEEDEGGVWYAPPQPRPAALAQPWAAATGQELAVWSKDGFFFFYCNAPRCISALFMLLASVGPAWLWCQVWYLQFRNCGLWARQWQGAFPGYAPHPSNVTSSTQSA